MDADAAPLLEARGLALSVAGRTLCRDLDVAVKAGECWAIVGPNGAGKTTLLRTLAGFLAPDAGVVAYSGRDVATLSPRERGRHRAVLPQDSVDAFPASVLESVLIGRHPHLARFAWETPDDVAIAGRALERFGLAGFAERDVRTLSGGERRRVALAALVAQDTPLALLDEPSSHLDLAQQAASLESLVARVRERAGALVMVLHDLHLALRFCSGAIAIGHGTARAGSIGDVLDVDAMSALFGRPLVELASGPRRTFVPR